MKCILLNIFYETAKIDCDMLKNNNIYDVQQ